MATLSLICTTLHHLLPAITIGNVIHLVTLPGGEVEMRMRCCPKMLDRLLVAFQDQSLVIRHHGERKGVTFGDLADSIEAQRQALNLTADRVIPDRRREARRAAG